MATSLHTLCAEAGLVGRDAETAITAFERALLDRSTWGADACRVASVVARHFDLSEPVR